MEVLHIPPRTVYAEDGFHMHKLQVREDGLVMAEAEMMYLGDPVPLYYVNNLSVPEFARGNGYGRAALKAINHHLTRSRRMGVLIDSIKSTSPAKNMYARHGWQAAPNMDQLHVFNAPRGVGIETIQDALIRVERSLNRLK